MDRRRITRRPPSRIPGKTSQSEEQAGSSDSVGGGVSGQGNADSPGLKGKPNGAVAAAATVRSALQTAASQLGSEEVEPGLSAAEVLADTSSCTTASRWRSGSSTRKFTAVLAKMLTLLNGLRPDSAGPEQLQDGLPLAEPRPLRGGPPRRSSEREGPAWPVLARTCAVQLLRPFRFWKTWTALLVVVFCPRLVALALSVLVRLMCRAVLLVTGRLVHELWLEIKLGVTHASLAVAELETQMIELLELWMGWPVPAAHQPPEYLTNHNFAPPPPPQTPAPAALPARPLELVHLAFLALLYRRLPGGGGNEPGPEHVVSTGRSCSSFSITCSSLLIFMLYLFIS